MKNSNKNLDFLHEVAKKISERSKQDFPISLEEVFDMFKDTLEKVSTVKSIELPIFMPVIIEQDKDGFYIAKSYGYDRCKGVGRTEEEAVQKFKEEIDQYNKSCINVEKKIRMEEIVSGIFPNDCF
jgi:predicted RNase H-like HicB family nuclease